MEKNQQIQDNREAFLKKLCEPGRKKGTILSDENGLPIISSPEDNEGGCACALFTEMFGQTDNGKLSIAKATKALGITTKDCRYIQQEINDKPTTFLEDAKRIEEEVFNKN